MEPGTRLGPYEIQEQLGAGGMGEVWLARDTRLGRQVAIKVLPEEYAGDAERLARFEQEARAAAALNHPNIASVFDVGHEDDTHFFVQEFLVGHSLGERIRRGRLPLAECLSVGADIAAALGVAHAAGVVHRDLKPDNVFVTVDGHVKVLDFGLAKLVEPAGAQTADMSMSPTIVGTVAGQIMGTAGYMAPEQIDGGEIDGRADLFALGAVLFELATGVRPFQGENVIDTLKRVTTDDPVRLATIDSSLPVQLQTILDRCLAKNPLARYAEAGDLAADLRELEKQVEAGTAVPLSAKASVDRAGVPLALTVMLVAAALTLGALAAWSIRAPNASPDTLRRAILKLDRTPWWGRIEQSSPIALSPSGDLLVFEEVPEPDATRIGGRLWMRHRDSLESELLVEAGDSPAFSPDGEWVVYRTATNQLAKRPVAGGAAVPLGLPFQRLRGVNWGSQGVIAYAPGGGDNGLFTVPADGGMVAQLTVPDAGYSHRWPHYSTDGQALIYTVVAPSGESVLHQLDLASGESTRLTWGTDGRIVRDQFLVWSLEGTIYAAGFDLDRAALTSAPVPVVTGVLASPGGAPAMAISAAEGALVYLRGGHQIVGELHWPEDELSIFVDSLPVAPTFSPDGSQLAYLVLADDRTPPDGATVWVHDVADGRSRPLNDVVVDAKLPPVWSADSRSFHVMAHGGGAITMSAVDGSTTPLAGLPGDYFPYSISPDGSWSVAVVGSAGDFDLAAHGAGSEETETVAAGPGQQMFPAIAPDGNRLAFSVIDTDGISVQVRSWPGDGAPARFVYDGLLSHPRWAPDGRALYARAQHGVFAIPIDTRGGGVRFGDAETIAIMAEGDAVGRGIGHGIYVRDFDIHPDTGEAVFTRWRRDMAPIDIGTVAQILGFVDDLARRVDASE